MTPYPRVTILAPAYNEEDIIENFVEVMLGAMEPSWELLIVDDGSRDRTPMLLEKLKDSDNRLRVLRHDHNRGLGAALATGFRAAQGEIVVTMDADLSHPAELVHKLVDACSYSDIAFASRYVHGGTMIGIPWRRSVISRLGNSLLRVAFATTTKDLTTGFRAYRRQTLENLEIQGDGFEAQLEISLRLLLTGYEIAEIPLRLRDRAAGSSKMRYFRLLPRYFRTIIRILKTRLDLGRGFQGSRESKDYSSR